MSMQEEELRRRRGAPAGGATGYEGIGGPGVMANQFASFAAGSPQYSFSGLQGQGGLAALLESMKQNPGKGVGPAGRNLAKQGFDIQFPGMDTQQGIGAAGPPVGGMNVAPGSPNGLAIGQSGQLPPGLAKQVADIPRTQGWRNLAPGYSAAAGAGFGSEVQGQFGGGGRVPPGVGAEVPGPGGLAGGGGGGRPGPNTQMQAGGSGPQNFAPGKGGGGGPAQGTGGPPGADVGPPGGGGTKKSPAGVTPQVKQQSANQPTARGGTGNANLGIQSGGGQGGMKEQRQNAQNNAYKNAQAGNASGTFGDTIHVVPNAGNNNTPSETRPPTATKPKPPNAGNNNTPSETRPYVAPKPKTTTAGKKKSGGGKPSAGGLAARRA